MSFNSCFCFLYSSLTRSPEVAKGHTDANATTRLTAAKDAASDKVHEKKHDVSFIMFPPSVLVLRTPANTAFVQTKSDVYANK